MGRYNNRRTQQAAQELRNTPARARFSNAPTRRKKPKKKGLDEKQVKKTPQRQQVVAKITKRVAKNSESAPKAASIDRLLGVKVENLSKVTIPADTITKIQAVLKDIGIIDSSTAFEDIDNSAVDSGEDKDSEDVFDGSDREDDQEFVTDGVTCGPIDDTAWDGDAYNEDYESCSQECVNDPVFLHLTKSLSFSARDASKACQSLADQQYDQEMDQPQQKLSLALDWLCLHLSEADLNDGFQRQNSSSTTITSQRIRPVPHPSISVATRIRDDPNWSRMTRLEDRAGGFLKLGFLYGEIMKALKEVDPEGTSTVSAIEDYDAIFCLLRILECISLGERAVEGTLEEESDEVEEQDLEKEALMAIYDSDFQHAGNRFSGDSVYRIVQKLYPFGFDTEIRVFLRHGYPFRCAPLFLVYNTKLPWKFLRSVNLRIIQLTEEIGLCPCVFEVVSFLLENLPAMFDSFERERQDQLPKSSPKEPEVDEEAVRQELQALRIKKAQSDHMNVRNIMASKERAKREEELLTEGIRKAGRTAMSTALNSGASREAAKMAQMNAEIAYRREHAPETLESESEESSVKSSDDQGIQNDAKSTQTTPTTDAFFSRMRQMYEDAKNIKLCTVEKADTTSPVRGLPMPVAPRSSEMNEMLSDIVKQQTNQPWLVAEEARSPSVETDIHSQEKPSIRGELDLKLKNKFHQRSQSRRSIMEQRSRLPAFKMREEIVNIISQNQVTLIVGSTGCGKTTQVPQLVLSDMINNEEGSLANILVTQPRRISAVGVATRVAEELGDRLGETCGYSIKLEKKMSQHTRILLCTTGILLRRLQIDPDLAAVSHVFIDEVHERDMLTDFLLIVLKSLIARRKTLKLVLMSATVSAKTFSNYFDGCAKIEIPGRTFPVQEFRLEDVLEQTGHEILEGTEYALTESQSKNIPRPSRSSLRQRYGQKYKQHVITSLSVANENVINYELLAELLDHIVSNSKDGAILVFMPGMMEITNTIDELRKKEVFQGDKVWIFPLHSMLSSAEQSKVFEVPPEGVRKIVVATNIAETSITIEDVIYVVDSGRVKENRRDELKETPALVDCWVSKASAKQRRGRSGRVKPGVAYHMYSSHTFDDILQDHTLPEILRVGVEDLVLNILLLDLGEPHCFLGKAINPPSGLAMKNSLTVLEQLGAIDCKWEEDASLPESCADLKVSVELTALGFHLATLPVEPRIGKILIYGSVFGCIDSALTIAASMSTKNIFVSSFEMRDEANKSRQKLSVDCSDHLTIVNAYNTWREIRHRSGNKSANKMLRDKCMNRLSVIQIGELRKQYRKQLVEIGFLPPSFVLPNQGILEKDEIPILRAVLCAGLYPNIIVAPKCFLEAGNKLQVSELPFHNRKKNGVFVHPSALLASETIISSQYCCFREIVLTRKLYIRDCTAVSDFSILLFGGKLEIHHEKQVVTIDRWIRFRMDRNPASLLKHLRIQMEKLLLEHIVSPADDNGLSKSATAVLDAVKWLLLLEGNDRNDGAEIVRPWLGRERERSAAR